MLTRPHWAEGEEPLAVCSSAYIGDSAGARKMTSDAIGTINQRLGFKLYTAADVDCDVTVVVGAPVDVGTPWSDPGGHADYDPSVTSGVRCRVVTANTGTDELLFYTLEHELGHCVGLAHDDWDGSIMRRVQRSRTDGEFPPWISDHDRALLRETYLP